MNASELNLYYGGNLPDLDGDPTNNNGNPTNNKGNKPSSVKQGGTNSPTTLKNDNKPTTRPRQEDPAHRDIYVPPESRGKGKGVILRWDPKLNTYLLAGNVQEGTPTWLDDSAYVEKNSGPPDTSPYPPRDPSAIGDWVDAPSPNADGPIKRLTKDGKIIQIGVRKDGKLYYFKNEIVNLIYKHTTDKAPPEEIAKVTGSKITLVTGDPPTTSSPEHPDRMVRLGDGKYGVLRWEPEAKRYVLVGTRETRSTQETINFFNKADYHKFNNGNNGIVPNYTREAPEGKKDWHDKNGAVWRYDPKLKREVQVGWLAGKDANDKPIYEYFSTNPNGTATETANDKIQSAVDLYNQSKKDVIPTDASGARVKSLIETWPSEVDPAHPDLWLPAEGGDPEKKYLWRWHKDLQQYVAISESDKPGENGDYAWYTKMNSGPERIRMAKLDYIPTQPDKYNPDKFERGTGDDSFRVYHKRWDPKVGDYVYIGYYDSPYMVDDPNASAVDPTPPKDRPLKIFSKQEFNEKNKLNPPPTYPDVPSVEDPEHPDQIVQGSGTKDETDRIYLRRWDPKQNKYVIIGYYVIKNVPLGVDRSYLNIRYPGWDNDSNFHRLTTEEFNIKNQPTT